MYNNNQLISHDRGFIGLKWQLQKLILYIMIMQREL